LGGGKFEGFNNQKRWGSFTMVHLWTRIQNDKVLAGMGRRVKSIFTDRPPASFYGDHMLAVYIGTWHDYPTLEAVVAKVISRETGWIRNCKERKGAETVRLESVLNNFGYVPLARKMFPHKENPDTHVQVDIYRRDGNFKMLACSTEHFHYVFCFDTS
jgi:hypothetical protein